MNAFIEELARAGRHCLALGKANRTNQDGLQQDVAHRRFSSAVNRIVGVHAGAPTERLWSGCHDRSQALLGISRPLQTGWRDRSSSRSRNLRPRRTIHPANLEPAVTLIIDTFVQAVVSNPSFLFERSKSWASALKGRRLHPRL